MAKEDKKEEANGFLSRFKSNMADYFDDILMLLTLLIKVDRVLATK